VEALNPSRQTSVREQQSNIIVNSTGKLQVYSAQAFKCHSTQNGRKPKSLFHSFAARLLLLQKMNLHAALSAH